MDSRDELTTQLKKWGLRRGRLFRIRRTGLWELAAAVQVSEEEWIDWEPLPSRHDYQPEISSFASGGGKHSERIVGRDGSYALIAARNKEMTFAVLQLFDLAEGYELKLVQKDFSSSYIRRMKSFNQRKNFQPDFNNGTAFTDSDEAKRFVAQLRGLIGFDHCVVFESGFDVSNSRSLIESSWQYSDSFQCLKDRRNYRRVIMETSGSAPRILDSGEVQRSFPSTDTEKTFSSSGQRPVFIYLKLNVGIDTLYLVFCWDNGLVVFPSEALVFSILTRRVAGVVASLESHERTLLLQLDGAIRRQRFQTDRVYQLARHNIKGLASSMNSDLNEMVDIVQNSFAERKRPTPTDFKNGVSRIRRKIDQVKFAVNSLGGISLKDLKEQRDRFRVSERIELIHGSVKPTLRQADISSNVSGKNPRIDGFHHLFDQIILNLLENSIEVFDARPEIGFKEVRIETFEDGDHVQIHYFDTAGGLRSEDGEVFPLDECNKIFEVGFSTKRGGSGFGMQLVRTCAAIHSGGVEVIANSAVGVEFKVSLGYQPVEEFEALALLKAVGS